MQTPAVRQTPKEDETGQSSGAGFISWNPALKQQITAYSSGRESEEWAEVCSVTQVTKENKKEGPDLG